MAAWFARRFGLPRLDPATQVLPVSGTREALFAIAQAVVDTSRPSPAVVSPNPFYQIYEGAALLAGAEPLFLNQTAGSDFDLDLESLTPDQWSRAQLVYVCSPGNPTGHVLDLDGWRTLFEYADRYGFVIASDECYSEIYPDEDAPPLGALEAARALGRDTFHNLVVFTSLSKRSNAPGLRSGGIAGDAALLKQFLLYRTYHGCAMSLPVQHASLAAWGDESHVRDNRAQYRGEVRCRGADARGGARRPPSRRQLLSVGRRAGGRRRGVHPRTVRTDARDRAAGAVSRAQRARREPGRRLRAHRTGAWNRGLRRGCATRREFCVEICR